MRGSEVASRVGLFVLVVLIAGALATVPMQGTQAADDTPEIQVESHQPENIVVDAPEETGSIDLAATNESKHVVFDVSHGNDVDRGTVAPVLEALTSANHTVSFYAGDRQASINETLRTADSFVIISPQESYTREERAGIEAFTAAGGHLLLAGEPPSQGSAISSLFGFGTVGSSSKAPLNGIASPYGLSYSDGYVYDLESYDNNYRNVYATPDSSFASSETSVTLHEATPISGGESILETRSSTKLSSDREAQAYTVAARTDSVVAIGDTSIFDSEWAQRNDNEAFVGSIVDFLLESDKEPGAPAPPEPPSGPSTGAPTP